LTELEKRRELVIQQGLLREAGLESGRRCRNEGGKQNTRSRARKGGSSERKKNSDTFAGIIWPGEKSSERESPTAREGGA